MTTTYDDDARRRRLPHARRVGAARRLLDALARAARQLAHGRQAGAGGVRRRRRPRSPRRRAGHDGASPRAQFDNARGVLPPERPRRRADERRRLDARRRPDVRRRRRAAGARGVDWRFNAWGGTEGGLYCAVGPRRPGRAQGARDRARRPLPRAARPRGRRDPRRRRGHAARRPRSAC